MSGDIRILLVEDDPGYADLIRELLRGQGGCEVMVFARLREACRSIGARPPDVMLLDLTLPDADGVDAVNMAVAALGQDVPIVVLTGREEEELASECLAAGAVDYLRKSEVSAQLLHRAIVYAELRHRGEEIRALEQELQASRLRTQRTGSGVRVRTVPLSSASPELFGSLAKRYAEMLRDWGRDEATGKRGAPLGLKPFTEKLIEVGATSRDVSELHIAATRAVMVRTPKGPQQKRRAADSRAMVVELLCRLADAWRAKALDASGSEPSG